MSRTSLSQVDAAPSLRTTTKIGRIDLLDVARGIALIAMLVYHFTWDLEFFGYLPAGTAGTGGWRIFARGIASSFLLLVGISFILAHLDGVKPRPFGKRMAQVAAGAGAVTVATFVATPQSFVFFGILHQIAVASVIALVFLRLPAALIALVGAAIIALPAFFATDLMNPRWLAWIGFAAREPLSNDLVPIFPWTGIVLLGMAFSKIALRAGLWQRLSAWKAAGRPSRLLATIGRHSLAFYLVHQPVSIAIVAAVAYLAPPDRIAAFPEDCRRACLAQQADEAFCLSYCACVQTDLTERNLLADLLEGRLDEAGQSDVQETILACSFDPNR
ncbi:heparan-alpha-glucosaminide N-acetyltransferase [Aureimonas populi]|uniref:Heparan-alpha-glucosaminide N-acetyltransferase n=1 Tax=Aureimonas populi TaxID=1701758 RepID=A0ABW5CQN7_9HYPH|nr:heparan-alpha-glucosaminide N-acetyltransferase [Aureimonas populi]